MASSDLNPQILRRMAEVGLSEDDLEESFTRGTGAGGQKINKTSSTVQLKHIPTGLEVRCQQSRQQSANRRLARLELCDRLQEIRDKAKLTAQNEREKTRRQTRARPRGLKEKILKSKHVRSEVKKNRRPSRRGED